MGNVFVKDSVGTSKWQNWAGNVKGEPSQTLLPRDVKQLSNLIWNSQKQHKTIRVTGAAHSFSPVAKPDDVAISLHHMRGLIEIDQETNEATFGPEHTYTRLARFWSSLD